MRTRNSLSITVGALFAAFAVACGGDPRESGGPGEDPSTPGPDGRPVFRELSTGSGIDFVHVNGATSDRYMPSTMGSGVAVLDFDGDGRQDLYFVDSGSYANAGANAGPGGNRLFRNLGGLRFEDVTAKAGVPGRGFGMGAVAGDYDADGHVDLYVTAFGPNVLYRNRGDGTFEDVTAKAGVDDPRWNTGAAFADFDGDGKLDLFVQAYVEFSTGLHRPCYSGGQVVYCTPEQYDPIPNRVFAQRDGGRFVDVSASSGVAAAKGKGLGLAVADFDDDGRPDVYCANDTTMNFLFRNLGGFRFEELGLVSGTGYGENGREEAGMGVDVGDVDGDLRPDLIVTNFHLEPNSVYRNDGGMMFTEVSSPLGIAAISLPRLGFGVRWFDMDNDARLDLLVANGHVYDNGESLTPPAPYRQPPTLAFSGPNGRFVDRSNAGGERFREPKVARGLALADLDDDGDLDAVITENGGRAHVYENLGGNRNSWISVRCVGTKRDTTAIGAEVTVHAAGRTFVQEVRSGGSYLSQSDFRLFFGLGDVPEVDRIVVRWPNGATEEATGVPARRHLVFVEGSGLSR